MNAKLDNIIPKALACYKYKPKGLISYIFFSLLKNAHKI